MTSHGLTPAKAGMRAMATAPINSVSVMRFVYDT